MTSWFHVPLRENCKDQCRDIEVDTYILNFIVLNPHFQDQDYSCRFIFMVFFEIQHVVNFTRILRLDTSILKTWSPLCILYNGLYFMRFLILIILFFLFFSLIHGWNFYENKIYSCQSVSMVLKFLNIFSHIFMV